MKSKRTFSPSPSLDDDGKSSIKKIRGNLISKTDGSSPLVLLLLLLFSPPPPPPPLPPDLTWQSTLSLNLHCQKEGGRGDLISEAVDGIKYTTLPLSPAPDQTLCFSSWGKKKKSHK